LKVTLNTINHKTFFAKNTNFETLKIILDSNNYSIKSWNTFTKLQNATQIVDTTCLPSDRSYLAMYTWPLQIFSEFGGTVI
jgi:hypothetical protein